MRLLVVCLSILSCSVFAASSAGIGDFSDYKAKIDGYDATLALEIVAFDSSSISYKLKSTVKIDELGQQLEVMSWVAEKDLWTRDNGIQVIQSCAELGGAIDPLWIEGTSFPACKLAVSNEIAAIALKKSGIVLAEIIDAYAWLGDFPINGIGKVFSKDMDLDLIGFGRATN